jgi:hypothetical protein
MKEIGNYFGLTTLHNNSGNYIEIPRQLINDDSYSERDVSRTSTPLKTVDK